MKILIAAGIYPPDPGGPATHAKEQLEGFARLGAETKIVVFSHYRKYPFFLRHVLYFVALLRAASRIDVVYAHDALGVGWPALIAARIFGAKVVVRIGGDIPWEREAEKGRTALSMREWYKRGAHHGSTLFKMSYIILSHFDAVIVPTNLLADIYREYYGVPDSKLFVIPNPIPDRQESRLTQGRDIIYASRLVAYKNLEFVIRILSRVLPDYPQTRFIIMGDGPEKTRLEKVIRDTGSGDFIKLLGRVSQDEVVRITRECCLGLAPALTEFNPNYILQCIRYGKPFLISKENGLPFNLPNEFVFDPRSEKDFESKVRNLLSTEGYRKALQHVEQIDFKMSWEDVLSRNFDILKSL